MSKKCKKYLVWFIAGQVVQIATNWFMTFNYMRHPVLCCTAVGFLAIVAVGVGMWVAGEEKPERKSYREYAEEEQT